MKVDRRRPYLQKKRAAGAASTRARILRAARGLFGRKGLSDVGIDAVAERAGVARATVFHVFGSKAGLLDAIAVDTEGSAEFRALLAALDDGDPSRALRRTIDAGCVFWANNARLMGAVSMLASTDQAVARAVAQREAARAESMADLVGRLAAAGRLRRGVGRRRATGMLLLATSFAAFDELRRNQGLPLQEVQRVLRALVEPALLGG